MNRLSNEQIMDYLDGTLSAAERARVESHLESHAEDAQTVRELQFAMGAAKEWHAADELRVSENFWPNLRDNLGPAPKRSWWSSLLKSASPAPVAASAPRAKWGLGAAFAAVALAVAMGAMMLAPQNAVTPVVATDITSADRAFIQQSAAKHEAYVTSQVAPGDTSSRETGAETDDTEDAIP